MPKLSVIIPVYNTEKYLRKCLDSVCNQTLQDIEIICVNDCSPDNSLEILKEYASSDNRIKIINFSQNKGAAVARNTAIDEAKGEYIGFVDSDDYIDLDFYEKLYERAKKDNADIAKSNLVCENRPTMNHNTIYHNIAEVQHNKLTLQHIPTTIIKKSLLDKYHILFPLDLKNAEDSVFEVMVAMYSNKIVIIESVFYHYEYNTSSLNNTAKYSLEKVKNILHSLQKIVAFLNLQDISQNTYQKLIIDRYDTIVDVIRKKFDGNLETLEYFENFNIKLKQQLKYPLPSDNINKIHLLKQIIQSRKNTPKSSNSIIPKRIFYVWFGGKKSILANVCIDNWQEKLQDFEFVEINEDSPYFDFKSEYKNCKWFREVYDRKLWAFASDYARIRVVYEYGGIYLDTDITIKKDLSPLLKHSFFIGEEETGVLSAGIFGAIPNHPYLQAMLDFYQKDIYKSPLYTIPQILTKVYGDNEFEIYVYPPEFFYPFHYEESYSPQCITSNTYTIHWWGVSWASPENLAFLEKKSRLAPHLETLRNRVAK